MGTARAEYTRADSLTAQARGGRISYYLYDGHGDVRALLDEAGAVTDRYRYSAYGELTSKTGNTENHYLYTGEYYDGTSGLYYLRARYMNPSTGSFLTMDTYEGNISDPVTLHKYLYANGNPVMYNDPSGHFSCATQAVATAIHDTLQTMYNVNLMGLMSGISNVAVNSVLGKQGMELVSSFFEGYQNGLYLTSILYLTVAVQVCALSVPVQAAYASTTEIKSLIYSRGIISSATRKKIDGVAVATARFYDAVAGQLDK